MLILTISLKKPSLLLFTHLELCCHQGIQSRLTYQMIRHKRVGQPVPQPDSHPAANEPIEDYRCLRVVTRPTAKLSI
jgi:hypothetical protein